MPYTELIEDRLQFIELDEHDIVELRQARQYIEPEIDAMLERFYEHVLSYPEFKALFEDQDVLRRAREAQKQHWLEELFGGRFKSSYFNKADRIGRAHARIGLAPSWYVGSYSKMLSEFISRICDEAEREGRAACDTVRAVCKAVLLDVDLVTHCYLEAKNESMREVLRRATGFANDVADLSDGLATASDTVERSAAALKEADAGSPEHTERLRELIEHVDSLVGRSREIEQRIGELQFGDRLYIEDEPSTLDRLKTLMKRD